MRKKVDQRIRTLVENGVKLRQRSLFVIVGDRGRDQVVNLHYMLSKASVKARPNVLWCYKKDLYLSSHRKKRMKQVKKMAARGLLDPEKEDPFSLFVASTNIRYCYYSETHNILGNTFGMCVLQDFEALTPNLLARTIETVEGGGIVVLLLSHLNSLTTLYSMAMDVHARYRTESHQEVTNRFNERFILSLADCHACLFMDDELNILPLSSHVRSLQPVAPGQEADADGAQGAELRDLRRSLADTQPAGQLIELCRSLDQAKAVVTFLDATSEKTLRSTVALTAGRGRGKSAALGLAIAGALGLGYANIFVTAPSPENLRTLFEFVFKGLDALGYKEHIDYDLVESTNPQFGKAIVRVNVFRSHRQTVQYVQPQHAERVSQAELLIIDEAAAIPLPMVKALLGPYLVFLCSTVNGYEGTGRSLSLKLIQQLREQGSRLSSKPAASGEAAAAGGGAGRLFREIILAEPIRYATGDPVERWLHSLLCLDAADHVAMLPQGQRLPHPDECELFAVNRDTLFSHHRGSEKFLQRVMALYVSSHYRNTPNDLQMLSDAPAHRLFVLLAPVDEKVNALPDVLAVVQVALEGAISRRSAQAQLAAGTAPQGDLIPWTMSQQFQDAEFPQLTGARVVRVAVHPELTRMGYGSRAVAQLARFYAGELTGLGEAPPDELVEEEGAQRLPVPEAEGGLLEEVLKPRSTLPPLLINLSDRRPEKVHWLGAAFGLTQELLNFWSRLGFRPVYLRQTPSDVTGECSTIVLRALGGGEEQGDAGWAEAFAKDFRVRYTSLLGSAFRAHSPALALSLLSAKLTFTDEESAGGAAEDAVHRADEAPLSPYDMKRLQSYASNLVDHHLVRDLVPPLARAYFAGRLPVSVSYVQAAILLVLGLQQLDVTAVEHALNLPSNQVLALFNKLMRKLHGCIRGAAERRVAAGLPTRAQAPAMAPHEIDLDDDLREGAAGVHAGIAAERDGVLAGIDIRQYSIKGKEADWEAALAGKKGAPGSGFLSVKRKKDEADVERAKKRQVEWPEEKDEGVPAEGARKKKKKDRRERD